MIRRVVGNPVRACVLFGLIANLYAAQESQVKKAPRNQVSGAELYKEHCAACHGGDLKGGGPVPSPYRVPPDLTTLARRHGGKFPDAYVSDVLRNGVILPAHGPAEMPVWGTEFRDRGGLDTTQVNARIASLTSYLRSFQTK